jgi:4-hydroxy-4-methyl-2-oxoglutarate aldolase
VAGIDQVGIPTFARGLSPNSPFKDGPGEIGFPVILGGVTVHQGDLLVGDADGVVVVPRADLASVAGELAAIAEKEAKMEAAVAAGAKFPAWLDEAMATGIRFVD